MLKSTYTADIFFLAKLLIGSSPSLKKKASRKTFGPPKGRILLGVRSSLLAKGGLEDHRYAREIRKKQPFAMSLGFQAPNMQSCTVPEIKTNQVLKAN